MSELKPLTIGEYTKIAEKIISSSRHIWMLQDEYIGMVVNHLINSDSKYDSSKGASVEGYRFRGWLNAKKRILQLRMKQYKTASLDAYLSDTRDIKDSRVDTPYMEIEKREIEDAKSKVVKELINHKSLNPKERLYLKLIYIDGKKQIEIAEMYKITKQAVSFTEQKALRKLRSLYEANPMSNN